MRPAKHLSSCDAVSTASLCIPPVPTFDHCVLREAEVLSKPRLMSCATQRCEFAISRIVVSRPKRCRSKCCRRPKNCWTREGRPTCRIVNVSLESKHRSLLTDRAANLANALRDTKSRSHQVTKSPSVQALARWRDAEHVEEGA